MNRHHRSLAVVACCGFALVLGLACSNQVEAPPLQGQPPQGLNWEEGGPTFLTTPLSAEPYAGDSAPVLEAQARIPTGSTLHSQVILRSCGPLGGVCHNRKEYPDMRTPANFVALLGAPCNVQSGTPQGVFDRCERPGDRVTFGDDGHEHELGWIELVTGEEADEPSAEMPGLHLHLAEPVSEEELGRNNTTGQFYRTFVLEGEVQDLSYANFTTRWHRFDEGRHVVGSVPSYRVEQVSALVQVGIEQGDLNRNGIFGARPDADGYANGPISMIEPGDPETSYLVGRMRGHMEGQNVPGSRMPLANPPFSVAEMIALFCFIEGLSSTEGANLESAIDYQNCSYNDPATHEALAIEGAGKGWADRVAPLLDSNCGGCHSEERAEGDLALVGDGVYDDLLETSSKFDEMGRRFVIPGDPQNSYLFLKLIGDPSIAGKGMPIDPIEGVRTLSDEELADIETWITDGAAP